MGTANSAEQQSLLQQPDSSSRGARRDTTNTAEGEQTAAGHSNRSSIDSTSSNTDESEAQASINVAKNPASNRSLSPNSIKVTSKKQKNHKKSQKKSRDGLVESVVLLIFLSSLSVCLEIALYSSPQQRYVSQFINLAYMLLGFIVLFLLWLRHRRGKLAIKVPPLSDMRRKWELNLAMCIFYCFSFALDVITLTAVFNCLWVWENCRSLIRLLHSADVVYHIVRPVYLFAQLFLCVRFRGIVFRDSRLVRLGLVLQMVIMISVWAELVLAESAERAHSSAENVQPCGENDNFTTYFITNFTDCFQHNTTLYHHLEIATPICFPSMIEFAILSIECIVHWFFKC